MDRDQALTAFSALAHADRLDLIRLLVRQGPEGLAAGQIGLALGGLAASRLSFHLAALEGAGLIRSRKVARNVIYAAKTEALGGLLSYLMRDCCGNDPMILACCNRHGDAGTDKT
jgi:ArsR family transcriptional regulator